MRHLLYLLAITLLFALTYSCSAEDESIIGIYKINSFGSSQCGDAINNLQFDFSANNGCNNYSGIEICGSGTLVLSEDNTWSINFDLMADGETITENAYGMYTMDRNSITICEQTECESSIFSIGKKNLTLSYPNPADECLITLIAEKN